MEASPFEGCNSIKESFNHSLHLDHVQCGDASQENSVTFVCETILKGRFLSLKRQCTVSGGCMKIVHLSIIKAGTLGVK